MKRTIVFVSAILLYLTSNGQTPSQIVTIPGSTYVYVGSLTGIDDSGNSQKMIVKIFGGSWFADSNGETTHYISNRGGLSIKQVGLGSNSARRLSLKAYQNGINIDFYIVPSPVDYTSFAVTSFTFGNGISSQFFNITTLPNEPITADITSSMHITSLMVTDEAGNIGIGANDTKGYKLAVERNMIAESVKVQLQSQWADYVFDDDYKPQSLQEIEAFVKKNKHLPEISRSESQWD